MNQAKAALRICIKEKKKKATHPLHRLYVVTARDGRKDCNNSDSLAHRMRGPIEAGGEETLGLISVRECPLPLSLSAPVVSVSRPRTCSRPASIPIDQWAGQIRFCSVTPDPGLPGSQRQVFGLAGIEGHSLQQHFLFMRGDFYYGLLQHSPCLQQGDFSGIRKYNQAIRFISIQFEMNHFALKYLYSP